MRVGQLEIKGSVMAEKSPIDVPSMPSGENVPKVVWNDAKMQTTYANVVNAASTREEVSLFFGTNQTWNFREQQEVTVELTDRIVLNPYAAKRLLILLTRLVSEHEKRFGPLQVEVDNKGRVS
jgi:hypothetical protein